MSLQTRCPGCRWVFTVPDALNGKRVRCKKCDRAFVVGGEQNRSEDAQETEDEKTRFADQAGRRAGRPVPRRRGEDHAERPPVRTQSGNATYWIIGGVAAGLLFLGCVAIVAGAYFLRSRSPVDANQAAQTNPPVGPLARPPGAGAPPMPAGRPGAFPGVRPAPDAAQAGAGFHIPAGPQSAVTYGPSGSRRAVVGQKVWDLDRAEVIKDLEGSYETSALRALDAGGRWLAVAAKSPNQQDTAVAVWSLATGKQALQIPARAGRFLDVLAFSDKFLVLGGRDSGDLELWDIDAGKLVRTVRLPYNRLEKNKLAFSPDGRSVACIAHDRLVLCSLESGKEVATLTAPTARPAAPEPDARIKPIRPGRAPGGDVDAVFVYAWTNALAFSPDGKELAAVSTHPHPRLLCWNTRGDLLLDEPVNRAPAPWVANPLHWLPDGSGWLVGGCLLDRASKRVVLSVQERLGQDPAFHVLDRGRLLGRFPSSPSDLTLLTVPWDQINAAVKALGAGEPSYLKPGQAVSVDIQIEGLRGDQAETQRLLVEALAKRLERDGVPVQPGQGTTLALKLAEKPGDTLPIYERQSPFDFRGKDTGRKATEAKGTAVLELPARGQDRPLWRRTLQAGSSRMFHEEITNATVRKSMLESLARQLGALDLPYFIPVSEKILALPVVAE